MHSALALNRITTPKQRAELMHHCGSAAVAVERLRELDPKGHPLERWLPQLQPGRLERLIKPDLRWCEADSINHILVQGQPGYPSLLRETPDPPLVLYVRGNPELLGQAQLAIVGSRRATPYGLALSQSFARTFAESGFVVTSGMAVGIDGAAQQEAVDSDRPTIAVFGTPIDRVFPRRNAELAGLIAEGGALLSEQPIAVQTRTWHFSTRNRIISGLSLACIVIEASSSSGSLVTARYAIEQGREVFAVPGPVHSSNSQGCHRLIREGATLAEHPGHVIEALQTMVTLPEVEDLPPLPQPELPVLSDQDWSVLRALSADPISYDQLMQRCSGLGAQQISASLAVLEGAGLAAFDQGRYQRLPGADEVLMSVKGGTENVN